MKRLFQTSLALRLTLGLGLLAAPHALAQASPKPITEHGLEQSLRVGALKDPELIAQINKRGVDFILSPDLEHVLLGAGASPAVLEAVRTHYRGPDGEIVTASPTPTPRATERTAERAAEHGPTKPALPQAPGIYLQRGTAWVALHGESAEYLPAGMVKAFGKASRGLLKLHGDVNGEIAGIHSNISATSPAVFLIRIPAGLSASDFLLVHTHATHDNREFKISADTLKSKDNVAFRLLDLSGTNLQIEVSQGAGDYAFIDVNTQPSHTEAGGQTFLYTFQIVP